MLHEAEGFAESAFDEISGDGVSAAGADGDAEACGIVIFSAEGEEDEGVGDAFFSGFVDGVEAAVTAEALVAGEFEGRFWGFGVHG